MASSKPNEPVDASDDLDDLDDILDEFNDTTKKQQPAGQQGLSASASTTSAKAAEGTGPATGPPTTTATTGAEGGNSLREGDETEEEAYERFARELAVGMEALMKGLGGGAEGAAGISQPPFPGAGDMGASGAETSRGEQSGSENLFSEEEMMKQFELMMKEMGLGGGANGFEGLASAGAGAGASASSSSAPSTAQPSSAAAAAPPANFQDAIKSTMSRLRESDATASSSSGGGGTDGMDLEKLMAALGGAEGMEGEEGIAKMLETMMGELMSKDVLYEPLKELKDKYPGYLANPPAPLSAEDRARYESQYNIVKEVVAIFDDKKFDTGTEAEKTALKAKVQTLMNEMQDNGAPPSEIVGDLPPELENMPGLGNDENCSIM